MMPPMAGLHSADGIAAHSEQVRLIRAEANAASIGMPGADDHDIKIILSRMRHQRSAK
jgi:hypothetical protein